MRELAKIFRICGALFLVGLISILSQEPAVAGGTKSWTLQESAGDVRLIKSNISPIALTTGDVLSDGDWIETGPDGQAVLVRGEERIVVAPNSRIGLPRANTGPFATRIIQTLGTILLTVEKQASQHFEVQTPYLAAVVKGTTFTVSIQGSRTMVHVVEGLVEVRDLVGGQANLVRPGQTGTVLSDSGSGVSVQGGAAKAATPATPSAPRGPDKRVHSNGEAQTADAIVIREALGPKSIDLKVATGGLIRKEASARGALAAKADRDTAAAGGASVTGGKGGVAASVRTATAAGVAQSTASALTKVSQPATSAVASATRPTASTLASVTQPATSTVTSVRQTATGTVANVVQPTTSTATSTVSSTVNLLKGLLH